MWTWYHFPVKYMVMDLSPGGTIQADIRDGMSRIVTRVVLSYKGKHIEPFLPLLLRIPITGNLFVCLHSRFVIVEAHQKT